MDATPAWKEEDFENFWKHYHLVQQWINVSSEARYEAMRQYRDATVQSVGASSHNYTDTDYNGDRMAGLDLREQ